MRLPRDPRKRKGGVATPSGVPLPLYRGGTPSEPTNSVLYVLSCGVVTGGLIVTIIGAVSRHEPPVRRSLVNREERRMKLLVAAVAGLVALSIGERRASCRRL